MTSHIRSCPLGLMLRSSEIYLRHVATKAISPKKSPANMCFTNFPSTTMLAFPDSMKKREELESPCLTIASPSGYTLAFILRKHDTRLLSSIASKISWLALLFVYAWKNPKEVRSAVLSVIRATGVEDPIPCMLCLRPTIGEYPARCSATVPIDWHRCLLCFITKASSSNVFEGILTLSSCPWRSQLWNVFVRILMIAFRLEASDWKTVRKCFTVNSRQRHMSVATIDAVRFLLMDPTLNSLCSTKLATVAKKDPSPKKSPSPILHTNSSSLTTFAAPISMKYMVVPTDPCSTMTSPSSK
mmetsp:Transcript_17697/g.40019  ORF Transcript_17697/g.40019 Transcript_17697/m.40019 type:complete len:300 (+) Transcript_17697:708-1607(+)